MVYFLICAVGIQIFLSAQVRTKLRLSQCGIIWAITIKLIYDLIVYKQSQNNAKYLFY